MKSSDRRRQDTAETSAHPVSRKPSRAGDGTGIDDGRDGIARADSVTRGTSSHSTSGRAERAAEALVERDRRFHRSTRADRPDHGHDHDVDAGVVEHPGQVILRLTAASKNSRAARRSGSPGRGQCRRTATTPRVARISACCGRTACPRSASRRADSRTRAKSLCRNVGRSQDSADEIGRVSRSSSPHGTVADSSGKDACACR